MCCVRFRSLILLERLELHVKNIKPASSGAECAVIHVDLLDYGVMGLTPIMVWIVHHYVDEHWKQNPK